MMNAPSPTVGITTYPADLENSCSIVGSFCLKRVIVSSIPLIRSAGADAASFPFLWLPPHAVAATAERTTTPHNRKTHGFVMGGTLARSFQGVNGLHESRFVPRGVDPARHE